MHTFQRAPDDFFAAGIFPTEQWGAERLDFLLATHFPLSPLHADYWANLYRRLASLETGPPLLTISAIALLLLVLIQRRTPGGDPEKADAEVSTGTKSQLPLLGSAIAGIVLACLLWGRLQNASDRFLAPIIAAEFVIFGISLGMLGQRIPPKNRALMPAVLVLLLTLSPMLRPGAARDFLAYWTYASGRSSTASFVRLGLGGTVEMFERANALPDDTRILAIAEARRYYFRRPITLSSVFDMSPIGERATAPTNDEGQRTGKCLVIDRGDRVGVLNRLRVGGGFFGRG